MICSVLQEQFDVKKRMVEITYLMHNQAKILKRLQIPQEDCKNKDLLFYYKLQENIQSKLRGKQRRASGNHG